MPQQRSVILRLYFVLVAFVTLMLLIFSVSDLVNISLKTWVFPAADQPAYVTSCDRPLRVPEGGTLKAEQDDKCVEYQEREIAANKIRKQQNAVRDISLIVVALPLFLLHFRIVMQDWRDGHGGRKKEESKNK